MMDIKIRTLKESEIEDQSSKYLDNSVLNPSTSKFLPEEIREDLNKGRECGTNFDLNYCRRFQNGLSFDLKRVCVPWVSIQ